MSYSETARLAIGNSFNEAEENTLELYRDAAHLDDVFRRRPVPLSITDDDRVALEALKMTFKKFAEQAREELASEYSPYVPPSNDVDDNDAASNAQQILRRTKLWYEVWHEAREAQLFLNLVTKHLCRRVEDRTAYELAWRRKQQLAVVTLWRRGHINRMMQLKRQGQLPSGFRDPGNTEWKMGDEQTEGERAADMEIDLADLQMPDEDLEAILALDPDPDPNAMDVDE